MSSGIRHLFLAAHDILFVCSTLAVGILPAEHRNLVNVCAVLYVSPLRMYCTLVMWRREGPAVVWGPH